MITGDEKTLNTSRQERYLKAVELLDSAHSYTRLGGVHALVRLADEYLTDQALQAEEKHLEGQRIVDVLCAYIRSPFELTSHYYELTREELTGFYADSPEKFSADRAAFREEAHIRQTLIEKISDRMRWSLAGGVAEFPRGYPEHDCVVPGSWSGFTYDFSGSVFFYPVDFVRTFWGETTNFAGCTYFSRVQFSGSFFAQGALFCRSNYHEDTAFNGSYYAGNADFSGSLYHGANDFMGCAYGEAASFKGSVFDGWVGFTDSSYSGSADFSASMYRAGCDFSSSHYRQQAIFENSFYGGATIFHQSVYRGNADFGFSVYADQSDFSGSSYDGVVRYLGSVYAQTVNAGACDYTQEPLFVSGTNKDDVASIFGSDQNTFASVEAEASGLPLGCWFMSSAEVEHLAEHEQELSQILEEMRQTGDAGERKELRGRLRNFLTDVLVWRDSATQVGEGLADRPMSAPDTLSSGDTEAAWDAWFREHMTPETP